MLLHGERLHHRILADLTGEVFLHIVEGDPEQVGQPVQQQPVDVLEPVEPMLRLAFVNAHEELDVDVLVHAFDVGEGVVVHIVLLFPEMHTTTEHVQGVAHHFVHPFASAIAAVCAIVHHIEPNTGHHHAEQ